MSGSFGGTTIEGMLENVLKMVVAIIVLILAHAAFTYFSGRAMTGVVTDVENTIVGHVQAAATGIKDHITSTSQNSSPRSNGNGIGSRVGSIEGGVVSSVAAAAEHVAMRQQHVSSFRNQASLLTCLDW